MTYISEVIQELEKLAPLAYQEGYDNAGLLVGSAQTGISGVLFTLDVTEKVVEEAIEKKCNLIIAHHPIIFKGLKKLNGNNYVERTIIKAIKNDIAIYAIHTNLDHIEKGVNWKIAERLGLGNVRVLAPKKNLLMKLAFFVPVKDAKSVLDALFAAGAGKIGQYENCSFRTDGTGTFLPGESAHPVIGTAGKLEEVAEHRIEVMFPAHMQSKVLSTLRQAHPYEEVAYYLTSLENENQEVGAGAVGELPDAVDPHNFLNLLKEKMQLNVIKHTAAAGSTIKRVAVCGGAGSFLLPDAIRANADIFITSDYKYHEYFDAENKIMICDIGHYESEVFTKDLLYNYLSGKFSNFARCLSEVNTNPVQYFV
ncbi:Nif3-like dinuclear metal center hexameric protein [Dyadobacter sediminis]|uniref:GTP cyclohydrolase 1 type 2 homolog n=1 Tax=Dyadobacter sediminis TaxID=1493691 RepID=A0A5R9KB05_9BACT|nr:Nif3-like dinuclear metal center hexameric protein [Dyadobacter sediminis]TLU91929.1 Nif3-like dinuclear metal center hexameric protein [Dyadobacter sediminis]GGB99030.1 GTP cyclohydrolase 1 type 2 [Dyadobacter sediminis]